MSLSYRVKLQVSEVVSADDKTVHQLDLRPVLDPEDMKALLRQSLQGRGFEQEGEDKLVRKEKTGETITVDLESLQLTAELEAESQVRGEVEGWGDAETRDNAKRSASSRAQEQAENMVEQGRKDTQRKVTRQLAEGEAGRLEEMNKVLQDVYSEALKQKARKMGEVVEQHEGTNDRGEYELVIKVEL
jgi:hypothetical protein